MKIAFLANIFLDLNFQKEFSLSFRVMKRTCAYVLTFFAVFAIWLAGSLPQSEPEISKADSPCEFISGGAGFEIHPLMSPSMSEFVVRKSNSRKAFERKFCSFAEDLPMGIILETLAGAFYEKFGESLKPLCVSHFAPKCIGLAFTNSQIARPLLI